MRRFVGGICVVSLSLLLCSASRAADTTARKSLNSTLPELKFDNVALRDAFEFLRDVSGANLHVNWKALEEIGVGKDTNINIRLRAVSLRKVMNLVLSEAASGGNLLTYYIEDNVIEVTTKELADKQLITKIYPIEDLLMEVPDFGDQAPQFQIQATPTGRGGGGGQSMFGNVNTTGGGQTQTRAARAQQLIELIQTTVKPEVWSSAGGTAAIRFFNGSLIVTAPRSVHELLGSTGD